MADRQNFGQEVAGYADKYESAMQKNAEALKAVAAECVKRGISTTKQVVSDLKGLGIDLSNFDKMAGIKRSAKTKIKETKDNVKDGVLKGAAIGIGAVIATGRLGRHAVVHGATTIGNGGKTVYTAVKGTAEKGLQAVGNWFSDRGKKLRDLSGAAKTKVLNAKGEVVDKVETAVLYGMEVKDNIKDKAETAVLYGMEVKDNIKDKAETVALYGMEAVGWVKDGARAVRSGVVKGAAMGIGAAIATGRLGRHAVVHGATTIGNGGKTVYTAVKGTAEKGLQAVGNWFSDRAKNIRNLGKTAKTKVLDAKDRVDARINTKAIDVAKKGRNFFNGLFDRLEESAISRAERTQEIQAQRKAAKGKESEGLIME